MSRGSRGSIYRRKDKDGKPAGSYIIKWRTPEGTWKTKTVRGNKHTAQTELTAIVGKVDSGVYQAPIEILFRDLAASWLTYKSAKIRPRTLESYTEQLSRVLPTFGHLNVRSITRAMVRGWETDLLSSGLSPTTCGHTIAVLKSIFVMAVEDDYLVKSPAISLRKPRRDKPKVDYLDASELKALLGAVGERDLPVILTLAMTGARRGETLGLTWDNVDFHNSTIHINQQLTNKGKLAPVKTAESNRVVPMPGVLADTLKTHQARMAVETTDNPLNLCFLSPEGLPWVGSNLLRRVFRPAVARAGLRHRRIHDLRHSYCVLLLSQGTPIKAVQKLMGHSSITITGNTYGNIVEGVTAAAVDTLQASVFGDAPVTAREDKEPARRR